MSGEETRPSIDDWIMELVSVVGKRSTCRRHKIGAITVRNKRILTTGYNGAPSGLPDCLELGCLRDELGISSGSRQEICRAIHAEQNAILQGAIHGVSLVGATLYCTHNPCRICAKMIVNAGIVRLVFEQSYDDASYEDLFEAAGVTWEQRFAK